MAKEDGLEKAEKQDLETDSITPEVVEAIKDLPPEKQTVIIRAMTIERYRSGPLPSSEEIRVYSEVIPNGGDRLMKNVEGQLEHRIDIEKTSIRRTYNQSAVGQFMAFGIALFFGWISWDLAKSGHDTIAGIIGGIDLVGLVSVFIIGRVTKK